MHYQSNDRARNWPEYNQNLIQRGSLMLWIDENTLKNWHQLRQNKVTGRSCAYTDQAILTSLIIKQVYRLSLRATQGLLQSLAKLLGWSIDIPHYTTLCKRQKTLKLPQLNHAKHSDALIHLVIDSTGIQLFGAGEWRQEKHKTRARRTWRKLHIAVNIESQAIEAFDLSAINKHDSKGYADMLKTIDRPIAQTIGDGAYDAFSCYEQAYEQGFEHIAPVRRGACMSHEMINKPNMTNPQALALRDNHIREVRAIGMTKWKQLMGYHMRSLAETAMYRLKKLFGGKFSTRKFIHQQLEAGLWCLILNKMSANAS